MSCGPFSSTTTLEPGLVSTTTTAITSATTIPTPMSTPTTSAVVTTITTAPVFSAEIRAVSVDDLGSSWRPGCPVGPEQLARLSVSFNDFDGAVQQGVLIVDIQWAEDLIDVFATLFASGFPIERMDPVSVYDSDDDLSMAANNTSAFNCRPVAGTNRWSEHSYGRAIDINPLINPYVGGSVVEPPGGQDYLQRDPSVPGLIVDGDVVVEAFRTIGWGWGGHWSGAKDYQHFSATGR